MLGVFVLLVSLYLYFTPKYRYLSIVLYIGYGLGSYGGYNILTNEILGIRNKDLMIIYTIIIVLYQILCGKIHLPHPRILKRINVMYISFLVFMVFSVFFSLLYYDFTFKDIMQGGRESLCILSYFIIGKLKADELKKALFLIFKICFLTGIIYILQVILGRAIMPYPYGVHTDSNTGLVRLYNFPVQLTLCLYISFFATDFFKIKKTMVYRGVFLLALICTQGRTLILIGIMGLLIGLFLEKRYNKKMSIILILGIFLIPVINMMSERFETKSNDSDLDLILSGNFRDFQMGSSDATMAYRFAWIYERAEYLCGQSLGENIFGLGLISDSNPKVSKLYHFNIGLLDFDTGNVYQLSTPDTTYGQMLTTYGYVGSCILISFLIVICVLFYKNRKIHPLILCAFITIFCDFYLALSSSKMARPQNYSVYFLLLMLLVHFKKNKMYLKQNNYELSKGFYCNSYI